MVPVRRLDAGQGRPTVELLHAADAEDRSAGLPGRSWPVACTRGDRVAFALRSSAELICAVLGAPASA